MRRAPSASKAAKAALIGFETGVSGFLYVGCLLHLIVTAVILILLIKTLTAARHGKICVPPPRPVT